MESAAPRERVVGLLLAAGRGRRFAQAGGGDKLLAPVEGRAVALRTCDALLAGCDAVVAVVRADAPAALCDGLRAAGAAMVVAADADRGMAHSLAAGVCAALPGLPDDPVAVLVCPADLPWLTAASVRAVADAARAGPRADARARIVVPVLPDGRSGHPVAFGADHRAALARLQGDRGARVVLDAHPATRVTVDARGILRDVDLPHDLDPP